MTQRIEIASRSFANLTILEELMNTSESLRTTVRQLCEHTEPPLDGACLYLVCRGAQRAFSAAMGFLQEPNMHAIALNGQLSELADACAHIYASREVTDVYNTLKRRLTANPGWSALAMMGSFDDNANHGIEAAIGVNLGLAFAGKKKLARAYMATLRKRLNGDAITQHHLLGEIPATEEIAGESWYGQLRKFLPDFWTVFDTHDNPPPTQKSINLKAISEWKGRSAFPSYRRRAAILDKTCFSPQQIYQANTWTAQSGFEVQEDYQVARWLVGFSGLYVESVHRIPILHSSSTPDDTSNSVWYDACSGLLMRDFSCVAEDAATAEGKLSEPASYMASLPAPICIAEYIRRACSNGNSVADFGDVIPKLRQLTPEGKLYPSLDELTPSWARWNRTVGPYLRQLGIDHFLSAVMVGDFGMTAKSKLYYARVRATEIWQAIGRAYSVLGLGDPIAMPINILAFGSAVVPSTEAVIELDQKNLNRLDNARPGKHCSLEKVIHFHNEYTVALVFRLMLRLSLRATSSVPISASIEECRDNTIDVREKGSANRQGAMPTLLTSSAALEITLYRSHCDALLKRLRNQGMDSQATQWLEAVVTHEEVPLFQWIGDDGTTNVVRSKTILDKACKASRLAEDFGRKFNENATREAGCRTGDIDRLLRHEVSGQEASTTVSDCSEETWVVRMRARLEPIHESLFTSPLHGLRSK